MEAVGAGGVESWIWNADWWQIVAIGSVLNVMTVGFSMAMWQVLVDRRGVEGRPVTRRDAMLATASTVVNVGVFVAAWWMWRRGVLTTPSMSWRALLDVVYLVVGLDIAMYCLHRLFHVDPLYGWFHQWHHTADDPLSSVTLFVMHPLEAAGFGAVTLVLMMIHPTSTLAVALFFTLNLIVGTIAHVPPAPGAEARWLGGSVPHGRHHDDPTTNFGFFTQTWDRLLGTDQPRPLTEPPTESPTEPAAVRPQP